MHGPSVRGGRVHNYGIVVSGLHRGSIAAVVIQTCAVSKCFQVLVCMVFNVLDVWDLTVGV